MVRAPSLYLGGSWFESRHAHKCATLSYMNFEGQPQSKEIKALSEKEMRLQAERQKVEEFADLKGMGVDEGIKETVAVFNSMELSTSASCEGHLGGESKHGYLVPWVDFEAPNQPKWRFENEEEIYEQVAQKYTVSVEEVFRGRHEQAWAEASRLISQQEETVEYKEWEKENDKLLEKVNSLLQEFYSTRDASDEARIIIDTYASWFRIHGGGKFYIPNSDTEKIQSDLTDEERARIPEVLKTSQQEMKDFTDFLHDKFIKEE